MELDEWPAPFTTSDIDLSKLDGFMLDTVRLLGSELVALSTGEEFKAAVILWCRAWKQTPPCSLPDDDRILASFAMVQPNRWPKIRAMALRGFVKCSDGRLYHRVLSADACRAWDALQKRRARTAAATEAKKSASSHRNDGRNDHRNDDRNDAASEARNDLPTVARDGTGRDGTVLAKSPESAEQQSGERAREPEAAALAFRQIGERVCELAGIDTAKLAVDFSQAIGWHAAGFDAEADIYPAVRQVVARPSYRVPSSLTYFTKAIREWHERRVAAERAGSTMGANGKADDGWL